MAQSLSHAPAGTTVLSVHRRGPGRPRKLSLPPEARPPVTPVQPPPAGPIIAVLNCFDANGRNACQVAIYADGAIKTFGEASLASGPLARLRAAEAAVLGTSGGR